MKKSKPLTQQNNTHTTSVETSTLRTSIKEILRKDPLRKRKTRPLAAPIFFYGHHLIWRRSKRGFGPGATRTTLCWKWWCLQLHKIIFFSFVMFFARALFIAAQQFSKRSSSSFALFDLQHVLLELFHSWFSRVHSNIHCCFPFHMLTHCFFSFSTRRCLDCYLLSVHLGGGAFPANFWRMTSFSFWDRFHLAITIWSSWHQLTYFLLSSLMLRCSTLDP